MQRKLPAPNPQNLGGKGLFGGGSNNDIPTRYSGIRLNSAVCGRCIPVAWGQVRVTSNLIWYGDFTSTKYSPGGKGLGKGGTEYIYSSSVVGALCQGPVTAFLNVWDTNGSFGIESSTESYLVTAPYTYAPTNASFYASDAGVSIATPYSYVVNDYGSPGPVTLSGTQNVPLTPTGGSPTSGEYSVDPSTGVYTFSSADAGSTFQISYQYYRYHEQSILTSVVPNSSPYEITVDNQPYFLANVSVVYYPSGTALTPVSGTPSVAGTYNPNGGNYRFAPADALQGVTITYTWNNPNTQPDASSTLNLTLIPGGLNQSPWSYLTTKHPSQDLGYTDLACVASSGLYLGFTPQMPDYSFEIAALSQFGNGIVDANPADVIEDILTDPGFGMGFPSANLDTTTTLPLSRAFWSANNFFISPLCDSQDSAASTIGDILDAGQVGSFYSEGKAKFVPYGDTSAVANGVLYTPPTQPVTNFTDNDFTPAKSQDPIRVTRKPYNDAYNKVQIEWQPRINSYNDDVCQEQNDAATAKFGLRLEDPQSWDFIKTETAATFAANMRVQRNVYIRNTYTWTTNPGYSFVEPMDIATLNDKILFPVSLYPNGYPVRITKVVDDPKKGLTFTAEDFPWGVAQPALYDKQSNQNTFVPQGQQSPGDTSVVIFQAPDPLALYQGNQLWIFASGTTNWGGCNVYVSLDGTNYSLYGTIDTPARIGTLSAPLASYSGTNPDTTDTLSVTLINNTGSELISVSSSDAANLVTLCGIVSASDQLELLSFENAALTGSNSYDLTTLYRAAYGTSGIAHSTGDLFCRLDQASITYQFAPQYTGSTIYFKFPAFNQQGNQTQSLADVTAYSFTLQAYGQGAIDLGTGVLNPNSNPSKYLGAWNNATAYVVGNLVELSGSVYSCIQNNTNENPSSSSGYWALVGAANTSVYEGAWSSTVAYAVGNQVTYQGNYYICTTANTNNIPSASSWWQKIGTSSIYLGNWSSSVNYAVGNQVSYTDGNCYIATTANLDETPSPTSSYWTLVGTSSILVGTWSSATTYQKGMQVEYTPSGGATNYYIALQQTTNNEPDTNPSDWYLLVNNTGIVSSASYRPTTNPLTATDAGSSATITIANFTMAVGGIGDVSVTGGSITGLSYGTLYYIYYSDPAIAGGSVTYDYTTTKSSAISSGVDFYVGSILTPLSGGAATIGNNDGGTGAQSGFAGNCYATAYVNSGTTLVNPGNMVDGNQNDYGTISVSGVSGSIVFDGISGIAPAYASMVLNVKTAIAGAVGASVTVSYSINGGSTFTNIFSSGTTRAVTVDQVTLPVTTPIGQIQVKVAESGGGVGDGITMDFYGAWLSVSG